MKTVYTCFCTDVIHEGHLNIIEQAHKLGKVVVGALSDQALVRYNKFPTVSLEDRIKLYGSIDGVEQVIELPLTAEEKHTFHQCCEGIRQNMEHLKEL